METEGLLPIGFVAFLQKLSDFYEDGVILCKRDSEGNEEVTGKSLRLPLIYS